MNDNSLRNIYAGLVALGILVIIVGIASAYFYVQPSSAGLTQGTSGMQTDIIEVSGTGTVTLPPDEGLVYLGVQTQSNDPLTAQQTNAETMEKVLEALRGLGIDDDDMVTSSYTLYPVRDYEKPEQTITGYVVSNQLKITVRDINKVGDVIDTGVDAGANEVQSVSFTLSEDTQQEARRQALQNAVKAARSDADSLADSLDVRITGPLQATTSGGGIITPLDTPVAVERGVTTPIQPGDVSVTAYVQVTYTFK